LYIVIKKSIVYAVINKSDMRLSLILFKLEKMIFYQALLSEMIKVFLTFNIGGLKKHFL